MNKINKEHASKRKKVIAFIVYIYGLNIILMNMFLIFANIFLIIKSRIYLMEIIISLYIFLSTSILYCMVYKIYFYRHIIFVDTIKNGIEIYVYKKRKVYKSADDINVHRIIGDYIILKTSDNKKLFFKMHANNKNGITYSDCYNKLKKCL